MNNVQKRIMALLRKIEPQRRAVNEGRRTLTMYHNELRSLLALDASRRPKIRA